MYITKVVPGKGKRYKIYNDRDFLFSLYFSEIKKYNIAENEEVSDDMISDIEKIVYKRAKERSLYLLEHKPYSENMMRRKLLENEYPEHIIECVIEFLIKYGYIDDREYIRLFVDSYEGRKSKKQLIEEARRRGISKENVLQYLDENGYDESESFKKLFDKYIRNRDLSDYAVRQKVFRYFYSKGYTSSMVQEALDIMCKNI